jgi:PAS domain S-box-containing protein
MTFLAPSYGRVRIQSEHPSARLHRWIATVVRAVSFTLLFTSVLAAQSKEPKHVLILLQEDLTWPALRLFHENPTAIIRNGTPEGVRFFTEALDRTHFPDPAIRAQGASWIQQKYAKEKLDLVIGLGDVPPDLFPDVPIVLVGVDMQRQIPSRPVSSREVVAVWAEGDARKTLELARKLQPAARQLFVICGTSGSDKFFQNQFRDQIASFSRELQITYLTDLTFTEISEKVTRIAPDSIVLFESVSRDATEHPFVPAEVVSRIAPLSAAPVYVLFDSLIGSGGIGGYVLSSAELGKQAGETSLQVLAGDHPEEALAKNLYLLDYRQLRRWKFSESQLPVGSTVLFRAPSLWQSHGLHVIGLIVVSLAVLLFLALLWQRERRRKVEASLFDSIVFERLLAELSNDLTNLPEAALAPTIEKSLARIGDFLRIERISIHEFSSEGSVLTPTLHWRKGESLPAPEFVKLDRMPCWTNWFDRGKPVFLSDVASIPEQAIVEREFVRRINARSLAAIPLRVGNDYLGCISFVSTTRQLSWTEELTSQLKLLAEIFSNALGRERARQTRFSQAALLESSGDAIISLNLDGLIATWSLAAQRMLELTEREALGQSIAILMPNEPNDRAGSVLQRLSVGQGVQHYEIPHITKGGKRIDLSLTVSRISDSLGRIAGASMIVRDVTDRRRAEQLLTESESRFRLVANAAPVLIWMAGTNKLCNFFNLGWLNFTGRTFEQESGNGWSAGVHPDDLERCLRIYTVSFDARADFEMEYRLRRFDGVYRWIVDFGVPRFEPDGTFCGYIGSCIDITERKSSEESLHQLSGRLIRAQEEERSRIARELHDDFSQRLALLGIGLGQLWKKLPESDEEARSAILELLKSTKEISSDIHTLSHQLHSSKLEHVGLVPALAGLCHEISQKYKIEVRFTENGFPADAPKAVALCLFRVAQEALANVVKYSEALLAQVQLTADANDFSLRISDNGRGFDTGRQNPSAGIGLIGMSERLRLVDGSFAVTSELMSGTTVTASVPRSTLRTQPLVKVQVVGR